MSKILKFDVTDLNEGQLEAFELFKKFFETGDQSMFLLKGYAGTGKTYLVRKILKYVHSKIPSYQVAVTAPTNKAVKVLSKSSRKDPRIAYKTVHKLLGLKEVINNDGTIKFENDVMEQASLLKFKMLIVDEVSMLDDELFIKIQEYAGRVKIIFMGDPAQIPPVNKTDCIPFNDDKKIYYDFKEYTLTKIMRQAEGNPIIEASFKIRNNLDKRHPIYDVQTMVDDKGHGLYRIDINKVEERDNLPKLLEHYFKSNEFQRDPDHAKVLAWRNVTINKMNAVIRNILYHDKWEKPSKIMVGEKLICNKPILDGLGIVIFSTNDEITVDEFDVATDTHTVANGTVRLKYYDTRVLAIDMEGKEIKRHINILHEESYGDFQTAAESLKNEARRLKGAYRSWPKYYEFLRLFADVGYNYAVSLHKSQGSTYKNVFIIEDDVDVNPNIIERNRIKYTGYSRASEKLYIMKK